MSGSADPAATLAELHPPGSFLCARTTRAAMAWNVADAERLPAYRLDATPGQTLGHMGAMGLVCHAAAATPAALDFLRVCGLEPPASLDTYRSEAEAAELARRRIAAGERMAYSFGVLPGLEESPGLVVPLATSLALNDKAALPRLVPAGHLAPRRVVAVRELARTLAAQGGRPCFVKVAGPVSSGGGAGVRHCADAASGAAAAAELERLLAADDPVVVEDEVAATQSWCAGLGVLDGGVRLLGASLQVFDAPASQIGNAIEAGAAPPAGVADLARRVGEALGAAGYRGVAGVDIGTGAGPAVVFDVNARLNSSTGLLLAFGRARARTGLGAARSVFLRHDGPLGTMLAALRPLAAAGRFIPSSLFDRDTHRACLDDARTRSCADGWVVADSVEQAARIGADLRHRLAHFTVS